LKDKKQSTKLAVAALAGMAIIWGVQLGDREGSPALCQRNRFLRHPEFLRRPLSVSPSFLQGTGASSPGRADDDCARASLDDRGHRLSTWALESGAAGKRPSWSIPCLSGCCFSPGRFLPNASRACSGSPCHGFLRTRHHPRTLESRRDDHE